MISDNHTFHPSILRAYDIRGTYGDNLFDADATLLGYKIASYFYGTQSKNIYTLGIVRDGRHSSPALHTQLCESLLSRGIHVIDFGIGPSPMGYYASFFEPINGVVIITASHNPKNDNGFKILLQGENLCGDALQDFAKLPNDLESKNSGNYTQKNIIEDYVRHDIQALREIPPTANQKIAWDFSHGAMCVIQPLIEKYILGEHFFLCETLDADFPSHDPDPTLQKNLRDIQHCITKNGCAIGFAFDGDGDRLVVLDHLGNSVDGDRLVALLAQDVLTAHPEAIILADIKSSRMFKEAIEKLGGKPSLTRTGHSFIKAKMRETGALLAGEMSGHIFFADENKGYDDGFYAACRVLRLLEHVGKNIHTLNAELPIYTATPEIKIPVPGHLKFELIECLQQFMRSKDIPFIDDDGVRAELESGWWLIRASNTEEHLIVRMEGLDAKALLSIREQCRKTLMTAMSDHFHYFDEYLR